MAEKSDAHLRVADLIANAQRRGDLEARYDDAVARLYSALEMAARVRLEAAHGVRVSSTAPQQVPPSLRDEFCRRYGRVREDGTEYLKIPHFAAYRLLAEVKDELAERYFSREKSIKSLMDQRNSSILAHGDRPVGERVYRELVLLVCEVAVVKEADLPRFPDLPA
jgi:CRISPR-associated protein (TIGR02710 family)